MIAQKRTAILDALAQALQLPGTELDALLAPPTKPEMGDLAFACFTLAKARKQAPPAIAAALATEVGGSLATAGIHAEAVGPFLNFRFDQSRFAAEIVRRVLCDADLIPQEGAGRTVVLDFSSPNIAKPFTMGHLRSTTIGNALARIHAALGYRTVRVNHLGDWGTQFGKLIAAFRRWGEQAAFEAGGIAYLMEIYVRFNDAAKEDPALDDEARAAFRQLEEGEAGARALWEDFRRISLAEFERLYAMLGVGFDSYAGESFYNDRLEAAEARLRAAGIVSESEGAAVVPMDEGTPPCMIRKSDGGSTYALRDLAALFYRQETYHFDRLLYVVGSPQALHFRQVFAVLEKLGLPWAPACRHIPFGQVLMDGQLMSTRRGNVVFLEDVIDRAAELALAKLREDREEGTDPEEAGLAERARAIAISSIIFYDLRNTRIKDVEFDWDEILNPRGETGVYLQYAHARINGIIRKFESRIAIRAADLERDPPEADEAAAYPIACELARFPEKVRFAAESCEPSVIARILLDLAGAFSTYYKANRVINEDDPGLSAKRLAVALAVRKVLATGLRLLGIEPLERM